MPSTLYLLRHAKSSWDDPGLADEERPLAPRGERAARRMAQHIREAGIRPALVLCSPARRTRQTLEAVAGSFGKHVEVLVEDGLYGAGAWELTARLRRVPTELPSVMVVGHNPGLQELALGLAGGGGEEALASLRAKFPTAALATLLLPEGGWESLARGGAEIVSLVLPRSLPRP